MFSELENKMSIQVEHFETSNGVDAAAAREEDSQASENPLRQHIENGSKRDDTVHLHDVKVDEEGDELIIGNPPHTT